MPSRAIYSLISFFIFILSLTLIENVTLAESASAELSKEHIVAMETHPLKNERVGYIDFIPLPPNYLSGYSLNERCFTGELFSKEPTSPLSDASLLFVPKDYQHILESSFLQTLVAAGLSVKKYSSIQEARVDGATLLIWGLPLNFHVENETKAVVKISYKLYRLPQGTIVWEDVIENQFIYDHLPWSISGKTLVFMVGESSV